LPLFTAPRPGHAFIMRWLILFTLFGAGCGTMIREAVAVQPNPANALLTPDDLPVSAKLYIHQRAPDRGDASSLPRDFQLRSWAQYAVVTRDRLRFHVGIARADEEEAVTSGWRAWLEDDTGRKYEPAGREVARVNRIAVNWRQAPVNPTSSDNYCRDDADVSPCLMRLTPGYTAYEGEADYVFTDPNLARAHRSLSLVMQRQNMRLRFTWTFGDVTQVKHYGRTDADEGLGTVVVPGPHTELAATRYENEGW
jgi:hypothetical protein